jgi:pimeloyl-ACP methyl ester carboxylesterase
MMPFSVLRIWGTGILSWAILAGGIYCLWQWNERRDRVNGEREQAVAMDSPLVSVNQEVRPRIDRNVRSAVADRYLLAGLGLLALSVAGFIPVTLFLGRPGLKDPRPERGGDQRFVERPDGTRLYVEVYGPQNAPTIIFTHGWSLDSTVWYYVKRELTRRFRVVVWDLPGLGRSDGSPGGDYRLEKMADDLGSVVESVSRGSVVLVGHSIGGMITQTYCRLYPRQLEERIAGIVLLHTTYTNPLRTAFGAALWTAIEKPILVPLNHLTVWLAPLAWLSNWQSYLNGTLHIVTRLASFSGRQSWRQLDYGAWLAAKAWPGVVARGNLAMLDFHGELTLPDIEVPTLVVAANHDRMTKPSASAHMDKQLPHGLPATINGGHLGFWERHEEVAQLLMEFMHRVVGTPKNPQPPINTPVANPVDMIRPLSESNAKKMH